MKKKNSESILSGGKILFFAKKYKLKKKKPFLEIIYLPGYSYTPPPFASLNTPMGMVICLLLSRLTRTFLAQKST